MLIAMLRKASAMQQAGCHEHLQNIIAGVYANPWLVVKCCPKVAAPQRGTPPIIGLAELAFPLVFVDGAQ